MELAYRSAAENDLIDIIRLLSDDKLGSEREAFQLPLPSAYYEAFQRAKARGAHLLQLTTDKKRPEAKQFYESLGFIDSHEGMKLHLK